jgi:chaperonin GroEL
MNPKNNTLAPETDHQEVVFGDEAHQKLLQGASVLAKAVRSTMGPSGHNVIIDTRSGPPLITKDGVTVARSINLKETLPRMGADLLKEVASKTNELAGDGTTTATVLGFEMLQQGIKMVATGRSAIGIKRGMDFATKEIIKYLKENAIKVRDQQDIISVGTISANGDRQIGELLAQAIEKVGSDGIITIEPAKSVQTTLEVVEGMQFDSGYVSPYFITNQEKMQAELINPYILITNRKISVLKEIVPLLESVAKQNRPLLIIGDEIEGEALHTLILNKMRNILTVCAVKAPSYGEHRTDILSDIAVVTNGHVFDSSSGVSLQNGNISQLGSCKKVIIGRNTTTIIGDSGNLEIKQKVAERVSMLRAALADGAIDDLHRDKYKKRLAKLSGGVAVIRVGGSTEVEILEKKDRVEDALNATVAAVQEGIVPGGGCALYYAADFVENVLENYLPADSKLDDDESAGVNVILSACRMPLKTIVTNTGRSADVVMSKLTDVIGKQTEWQHYGYDAATGEYGNLIDKGIIDPVKVSRYALEHACSVIGLMLTCDAVIVNEGE